MTLVLGISSLIYQHYLEAEQVGKGGQCRGHSIAGITREKYVDREKRVEEGERGGEWGEREGEGEGELNESGTAMPRALVTPPMRIRQCGIISLRVKGSFSLPLPAILGLLMPSILEHAHHIPPQGLCPCCSLPLGPLLQLSARLVSSALSRLYSPALPFPSMLNCPLAPTISSHPMYFTVVV